MCCVRLRVTYRSKPETESSWYKERKVQKTGGLGKLTEQKEYSLVSFTLSFESE